MRRALVSVFLLLILGSSCQPEATEDRGGTSQELTWPEYSWQIDTLAAQLDCEAGEACVYVSLEQLSLQPDSGSLRVINADLRERSLRLASDGKTRYQSRQAIADSLFKEYQTLREEGQVIPFPWELKSEWKVILSEGPLLSTGQHHYRFTGGAHGHHYREYRLYDLSSGVTLKLDSLIPDAQMEAFRQMAENRFVEKYEVDTTAGYNEAGYWFEEGRFHLPLEFRYDGEGLRLIYNVYEIAPYSEGLLSISFSKDELCRFGWRL